MLIGCICFVICLQVNTARQSDLTACSHQTGLEAESIGEKNVIFAEEIEHVQDSAREIIDHTGKLWGNMKGTLMTL